MNNISQRKPPRMIIGKRYALIRDFYVAHDGSLIKAGTVGVLSFHCSGRGNYTLAIGGVFLRVRPAMLKRIEE